jgi:hypothetical protein
VVCSFKFSDQILYTFLISSLHVIYTFYIILPYLIILAAEPFTLKEEHRLRLCENMVLDLRVRKWREAGGWRRLHDEELRNMYTSPYVISMIKLRRFTWAGLTVCMGR